MFEAYAVGIKLSLIDRVTSGLIGLARQFHTVHGSATALQGQLNKIKLLTMGGAVVAGTGLFGLALIGKTLPAAKEYAHQLQQMNIAGMKQVEIAKAAGAAWGAAKSVPTSSASENLAAIRELRMVFGDTNHAIANMPTVQRLQAVLANTKGGMKGGQDEAYTVAKALEMKGAVRTPGEFTTQADLMAKAIVASGGKIGAADFLGTFKYGRSATMGWNDSFTYSILPTLIQEMKSASGSGGAGGPGNALMSVYDKVINGKIAQKDLPLWSQLGLIDSSKIVRTKTGATKGLLPGAVAGWDTFQHDPYQWTQSVLMPALIKHGITDPGKQQMYLSRLGGTRTAAFMLQQMGMQSWKFDRDQKLIRGASGLAAYNQLLKSDPMMADLALQKQWKNLLTVIGIQIMPALVDGTLKLMRGLTGLSNWMRDHPNLTKGLVIGFAALSAAMAIGGTVMMIAGAFAAVGLAAPVVAAILPEIATALTMLGGAAAMGSMATGKLTRSAAKTGWALGRMVSDWALAHINLTKAWSAIRNGISGFIGWIVNKAKEIGGFVAGLFGHAPKTAGPSPRDVYSGGRSPHVHAPQSQWDRMTGGVHMDGKKVGKIVWQHQARDMARPPVSGGAYDGQHQLTPVGAGNFAI